MWPRGKHSVRAEGQKDLGNGISWRDFRCLVDLLPHSDPVSSPYPLGEPWWGLLMEVKGCLVNRLVRKSVECFGKAAPSDSFSWKQLCHSLFST